MKHDIIIPSERIVSKIYIIRGQKVMLDRDLAELYGVQAKVLNQAVKRNSQRFPADFMFRLDIAETKNLRSQIVTSSWGGRRYSPFAFTEHGVAMLASVLNSDRAIAVNIQIIRTFARLRELLVTNEGLRRKIEELEQRYDKKFKDVFVILKMLLKEDELPREEMGFKYVEVK